MAAIKNGCLLQMIIAARLHCRALCPGDVRCRFDMLSHVPGLCCFGLFNWSSGMYLGPRPMIYASAATASLEPSSGFGDSGCPTNDTVKAGVSRIQVQRDNRSNQIASTEDEIRRTESSGGLFWASSERGGQGRSGKGILTRYRRNGTSTRIR